MTSNALQIMPEWIEVEAPIPYGLPLRQTIADKFYALGKKQGYLFLPNISGMLSTTFSHPVFAMPHLDAPVSVHGFHTAFRPTDNDEGTHLVAFGQYYICTNALLTGQFEFIQKLLLDVICSSFPSDLGLTDIKLEEGHYEWQADSTGYKGGGGEVNVTAVTLDGKEHKIGRLELAQINDYAVSGDVQGKPCHLIVFGIDRLINLYAIMKTIKEQGAAAVAHLSMEDLYRMEKKEAALHKGLIDVFLSAPANSDAILASIYAGLYDTQRALEKKEFNPEVFARLGQVSSLVECAYAANAITRNYRQYLIRKLGRFYSQFAQDIETHPQTHLQTIRQLIMHGTQSSIAVPSIFDIFEQPFLKRHFNVIPRVAERKVREDLIPQSLIEFFRDEEIGQEPGELPQFLLKRQMFCRAVGGDLAIPVETLAQPTKHVFTLTGSVAERITRIGILLDFLNHEGMPQNASINYEILKHQLRYLAVEWQYRSIKIYPQLEGSIGAIAMQQQGYEEPLIQRIRAFHLAGTKRQGSPSDRETLLLILVGKLDEAVSLFVRSTENGRSISGFDPFGVKTKIAAAVDAAEALELDLNSLRKLLVQIIRVNPDTIGDETMILKGYFWARIEKGFSRPKQNTAVAKAA